MNPRSNPDITWRGEATNHEINLLHARAFGRPTPTDDDWNGQLERWSLGWVTARVERRLVGFTNVLWDGGVHAWLQDVVVEPDIQRSGIGRSMIELVEQQTHLAGCEWLHVDFDDNMADFYLQACGFRPTAAGLRWVGPDD